MQVYRSKLVRGVSLVEVIFSIGVIIIGILGVMSILPLAGRRAQDSVSMSIGAAMGDSIAAEILSNRWNQNGQLRILTPADTAVLTVTDAPVSPFVYTPTTFTIPEQPFCIDPMLTRADATVTASTDQSGFNTVYFPYYKPTHNPTVDPSELAPAQLAEDANAPAPLRRLIRVGLLRQPTTAAAPVKSNLLSTSEAFRLAERSDDVRFERPKDRTLPAIIPGVSATSLPGATTYGTRFGSGAFSWIATVVPEQTPGYATLSVVVIRNRLRDFDMPSTNPATIPERNASAERLAYVNPPTSAFPPTGFVGGAGGMVTISSSLNTVSRMQPGQWVMLSGFTRDLSSTSLTAKWPIHRWYRIAALGGDVVKDEASGTWSRELHLDGPDWFFPVPTILEPDPTETFMTIVDGVVSVSNHFVRLDSL